MWITAYPPEALDKARRAYDPAVVAGMEAGIVALYPEVPPSRLPRASVRDFTVVRVSLSRIAVQPGR